MKKIIIACLIISACATTKTYVVKSHEDVCEEISSGKFKKDIIYEFGPYDRVTEDGKGGQILVYALESERTVINHDPFPNSERFNHFTIEKSSKIIYELAFYLDTNESCYRLRTEGYNFTQYASSGDPIQYNYRNPMSTVNPSNLEYPEYILIDNIKYSIGDEVVYTFSNKPAIIEQIVKDETKVFYHEVKIRLANNKIKHTSFEYIVKNTTSD